MARSNSNAELFNVIKTTMLKDHRNNKYIFRFMSDLTPKEEEKMEKMFDHEDIYFEGRIVGFMDMSNSGNLSTLFLVTTNGIYYLNYTLMSKCCNLEYKFDKKNKCIVSKGPLGGGTKYKYGDDYNHFGMGRFAPIFDAVLEYFENCDKPKASDTMQKLEAEDYDD